MCLNVKQFTMDLNMESLDWAYYLRVQLRFKTHVPDLRSYIGDTLSLSIELNNEEYETYERVPGQKMVLVDMAELSKEKMLSLSLMKKHENDLDWGLISRCHLNWNDEMYEMFEHKIKWLTHLRHRLVNTNTLRKFMHKFKPQHLVYISYYQILDFEFIKEFQRRLPRDIILANQFLSDYELSQLDDLKFWGENTRVKTIVQD